MRNDYIHADNLNTPVMIVRYIPFILLVFSGITALAQGSCNDADLSYMADNMDYTQQVATDCGTDCLFAANPDACMQACMGAVTPLSASCISCFSQQVDCVVDNCFFSCAFSPGSPACATCVETNCLAPFQECAGIHDNDNDGWTNLYDCDEANAAINPDALEIWYDGIDQNCDGANDFDQDGDGDPIPAAGGADCDDTNPAIFGNIQTYYLDNDGDGFGNAIFSTQACTLPVGYTEISGDCLDANALIYPGAPGTGDGVDNNCNGIIEGDELEVECFGDLNNDLAVTTADLLIFLTEFGCEVDCIYDFDGDGETITNDLLLLLAFYGTTCE